MYPFNFQVKILALRQNLPIIFNRFATFLIRVMRQFNKQTYWLVLLKRKRTPSLTFCIYYFQIILCHLKPHDDKNYCRSTVLSNLISVFLQEQILYHQSYQELSHPHHRPVRGNKEELWGRREKWYITHTIWCTLYLLSH